MLKAEGLKKARSAMLNAQGRQDLALGLMLSAFSLHPFLVGLRKFLFHAKRQTDF
jgi:hypothetical protein